TIDFPVAGLFINKLNKMLAVKNGLMKKFAHKLGVIILVLQQRRQSEHTVKILEGANERIKSHKIVVYPVNVLVFQVRNERFVLAQETGNQTDHKFFVVNRVVFVSMHISLVGLA